jgi:PAS domain S-box-containing protein
MVGVSSSVAQEETMGVNGTRGRESLEPVTLEEQKALEGILALLLGSYRIDFSHYRRTTVLRRLSRRVALCKQDSLETYRDFLDQNPDELHRLYDDLLLSFTEFFRDPPVFETLKRAVFPRLVEHRSARTPIRIWVPGCATGEEVYSLAVCLHEFLEENRSNATVQLFGTDLVERHVEAARAAVYPDKIRKHVTDERLKRFFDSTSDGLTVTKHIRQMCVFAVQDVTQDPPFPKIDLVSCRNVLIYFDAAFQEIAIPLFHFALRPGGFLLLGASETMGQHPELFTAVDQRVNLYAKRISATKPVYRFPFATAARTREPGGGISPARIPDADISRQVDELLLDRYAPAGVLVDGSTRIRQFRGHTSRYLEPASGEASLKLSRMAKEGLMLDISLAIEEAKKKSGTVRKEGVAFGADAADRVDVVVSPVSDQETGETCFLVLFEEPTVPPAPASHTATGGDDELYRLRRELETTKAHLQAIIEEKEEVNQELWAANEEVQSTNEELQSVNEELEAAKEELESSNEELLTLNEELRAKNLELVEAEAKFRGLVETSSDWIWEVDRQGVYTYSSPQAESMLGFAPDQLIGRKPWDLMPAGEAERVARIYEEAAQAGQPIVALENINLHRDGRPVVLETAGTPVLDSEGAVTGFRGVDRDITERKRAAEELAETKGILEAAIAQSPSGILIADAPNVSIRIGNPAGFGIRGGDQRLLTGIDVEQHSMNWQTYRADGSPYPSEELPLSRAVLRGEVTDGEEVIIRDVDGSDHWVSVNAAPIRDAEGRVTAGVVIFHDITERKQAEEAARAHEERFRVFFSSVNDAIFVHPVEPEGFAPFIEVNDIACQRYGFSREELLKLTARDITTPESAERFQQSFRSKLFASGRMVFEVDHVKKSGEAFPVEISASIIAQNGRKMILSVARDITERKQAEERVRTSEAFLAAVFASIQDGVSVLDTELNIQQVSPVMEQWYADQLPLVGKKCYRCYQGASKPCDPCPSVRALESGKTELDVVPGPAGSPVEWIELFSYPIKDPETGATTGVVEFVRDITERKQAEEALQESERRYRSLVEFTTDGVFCYEYDPPIPTSLPVEEQVRRFYSGRLAECNATAARAYGRERPEEVLGRQLTEVFGAEPGGPVDRLFTVFVENGYTVVDGKGVEELPDGSRRYFSNSAYGVVEGDVLVRIWGTYRDITERRRAERKLAESEARFRGYVESAPDGIFVVDEQGRYVDVNEAACRITGYPREELLGTQLLTLVYPEDRRAAEEHFAAVVNTGRASGEARIIQKDGTIRHWVLEAVKLAENRLLGFAKDVTESKQMLDQLRHAEKMQAVGQLAGGIAHDFNNQLSGILGYADILREEAENNPVLAEYADNIMMAAKRAADLTSQLLAFSRKGKYLNTTVDMHRIVFEAANLLRRSIDKRIVIRQELRANPPTTLGDPTQLQNAVLNLALNARDAMPDGGRLTFATDTVELDRVQCEALSFTAPGRFLQVSVTDTGVGMTDETRARIFEPFFTTKAQGRGTGMGLAAVYGTVKSHGGAVTVESQPGCGSTFVLHLPLSAPGTAAEEAQEARDMPIDGGARILLVDDEEIVRGVAARMLENLGYTVTVCGDGAEAVALYRERWSNIDLVILDVVMPVMDGEEAFVAMREINPEVVVLVSSGYSIDGKAESIIARGARGFIQKPFRKGELSKKVHEMLGGDGQPSG